MIIPKIGNIYKYKGIEFGVCSQKPLFHVDGLEYSDDKSKGSDYKSINWIDFALNAKYVRKMKYQNTAY